MVHVTSDDALLGRVVQEMRERLAGREVQVTIEMDDLFEGNVVRVDGPSAGGGEAWGYFRAEVIEGDPLGGGWSAFNDFGHEAHSYTGDLDKFAQWWIPRD